MRKLILQEFVTLDGRVAGPEGEVDFVPATTQGDAAFGKRQLAFMDAIDTILLGRVTYQIFSQYWPQVTSGDDKPFADKLNRIPKIVFSRTLEAAPWGDFDAAKLVRDRAEEAVANLKEAPGKGMVIWGSVSIARSLLAEELIDEFQIVVCPTVLGPGRPLFPEGADPLDLKLLGTESFDRGGVLLRYAATP